MANRFGSLIKNIREEFERELQALKAELEEEETIKDKKIVGKSQGQRNQQRNSYKQRPAKLGQDIKKAQDNQVYGRKVKVDSSIEPDDFDKDLQEFIDYLDKDQETFDFDYGKESLDLQVTKLSPRSKKKLNSKDIVNGMIWSQILERRK